jgi:hypothetical protein
VQTAIFAGQPRRITGNKKMNKGLFQSISNIAHFISYPAIAPHLPL